jgi:hypothetical protein
MIWTCYDKKSDSAVEKLRSHTRQVGGMNKLIAVSVVALSLAPSGVLAQERVGDAALGAVSGLIVLGPVGAVAGAVIGYTAGPTISHPRGMRDRERLTKRSAPATQKAPQPAASTPEAATKKPAQPTASVPEAVATEKSAPLASVPEVKNSMPPVQTLD